MTTHPVIRVIPVRCKACGLWTLEGRPCPACQPAHPFHSHQWAVEHDGEMRCQNCYAKPIHDAAWMRCPHLGRDL